MDELVFVKLGGSLITEKDKPRTPRLEILARLAFEISSARRANPELKILLGHGSGSFGHQSANRHQTRLGVNSIDQWTGFVEVWRDARVLNQIVLEMMQGAGLPILSFPPSACATTVDHRVKDWNILPINSALDHNLIPLLQGDVVFDSQIGGTILSTEEIFQYLAPLFKPSRILLAGLEPGIWADFPACTRLISRMTKNDVKSLGDNLSSSSSVDVTGGMAEKVKIMFDLMDQTPNLEVSIFSGLEEGALLSALTGSHPGTTLLLN